MADTGDYSKHPERPDLISTHPSYRDNRVPDRCMHAWRMHGASLHVSKGCVERNAPYTLPFETSIQWLHGLV